MSAGARDSTALGAPRSWLGGARRCRRRGKQGLVTLEWLLILGAVGAFAALAVLVVERTLDAETELPPDPAARLIDADIDAAFVASEAVRAATRGASTPDGADDYSEEIDDRFRQQCEGVATSYGDVVDPDKSDWKWDWDWENSPPEGDPLPADFYPEMPARCELVARDLSAGDL